MESVLFSIKVLFTIVLVGAAIFLGFVALVVRTWSRIFAILSYTTFKTSCEVAEEYRTRFRPMMGLTKSHAEHMLKAATEKKMVIERESDGRCGCTHEYCLSVTTRRRRTVKTRVREAWDGAWRPA